MCQLFHRMKLRLDDTCSESIKIKMNVIDVGKMIFGANVVLVVFTLLIATTEMRRSGNRAQMNDLRRDHRTHRFSILGENPSPSGERPTSKKKLPGMLFQEVSRLRLGPDL